MFCAVVTRFRTHPMFTAEKTGESRNNVYIVQLHESVRKIRGQPEQTECDITFDHNCCQMK